MSKDLKHDNRNNMNQSNGRQPTNKPQVNYKAKNKSKLASLYENHKDDLGVEYSLNDIVEIGYPYIETTIDIISSGKPSDILQDIHVLLIELIEAGVNTKTGLIQFLGLAENDFILDELYTLLEAGIISIASDDEYRVTTKGAIFVQENKFIPVTNQEDFKFYVDGLTNEILPELPSEISNVANRLTASAKVNFDFIQESWLTINKCYAKINLGDKEIVDLANYKRSIIGKRDLFVKLFVLIYYPKDKSGKKLQIKVYGSDSRNLKTQTESISSLFASNKYLLDFSKDYEDIEEYKQQFLDSTIEIKDDKLSGKYLDISTFEHKELIKDALLTGTTAVYIESPWIRKATMEYISAMDLFMKKRDTKLFIAYGIDTSPKNAPHRETFEDLEKLRDKYPGRVFLFHLPTHFKVNFPKRDGSHRKILIKDFDFYIKGSYNWLSYSGNEKENYAVEEGTQFFNNVKEFWRKVFSDYKLDESLLDFISLE